MIKHIPEYKELLCDCCGGVIHAKRKFLWFYLPDRIGRFYSFYTIISKDARFGAYTHHICYECYQNILECVRTKKEGLIKRQEQSK